MMHCKSVCGRTFLLCRNIERCIKHLGACLSSQSPSDQPKQIEHDMVGSPNPVSNLRPTLFYAPENETSLETAFRLHRDEVQKWNQAFWTKHNSNFFKQRDEFIAANIPKENRLLTADEMSVFYKTFLDQNWKSHLSYNLRWYYKNVGLLVLAARVALHRTARKLSKSRSC